MGDDKRRLETDFGKTLDDLSGELTRSYIRRLINLFPNINAAEAEEIKTDTEPADRFFRNLKANKDICLTNVDLLIENLQYIQLIKAAGIVKRYKERNVNLINTEIERQRKEERTRSSTVSSPVKYKRGGEPIPADDIQNKIFISFKIKDEDKICELKHKIEDVIGNGSCWICTKRVKPGDNLDGEITRAINEAKVILCFITQPYVDSKECEMEFLLARQLNKEIILIHMEKVQTPYKKGNGEISPMQLAAAQQFYISLYGQKKEEGLTNLITKLQESIRYEESNGVPSTPGTSKRGSDGGDAVPAKKTKKA